MRDDMQAMEDILNMCRTKGIDAAFEFRAQMPTAVLGPLGFVVITPDDNYFTAPMLAEAVSAALDAE